jgi:hypothetical protein
MKRIFCLLILGILLVSGCIPTSRVPLTHETVPAIDLTAEGRAEPTQTRPASASPSLQATASLAGWGCPDAEGGFELVGQAGGASQALLVDGERLYLGVGPRLAVYDLSDPGRPRLAGVSDILPGLVRDLAIEGEHLYALLESGGLAILSLKAPSSPALAGVTTLPGPGLDLAVSRGTAYVAAGPVGLLVVEAGDPDSPRLAGQYETGYITRAVATADDLVLAGGQSEMMPEGVLLVFERSGPLELREAGRLKLPFSATAIALRDEYAFLASDGLRVVHLSDPAAPVQVGFAPAHFPFDDLALAGDSAYLVSNQYGDILQQPRRVWTFDINDPFQPQALDSPHESKVRTGVGGGGGRLAWIHEGWLYLAAETGLLVFDASSLELTYRPQQIGPVVDLAVEGRVVYTVNGYDVLSLLEAGKEGDLPLLGSYTCEGCLGMNTITAANEKAYLGFFGGGVRMIEVSDPSLPAVRVQVEVQSDIIRLAARGDYLYLLTDSGDNFAWLNSQLKVYDLSLVGGPVSVGSLNLDNSRYWEIVLGEVEAYLVGDGRIDIVDVGEPSQPRLLDTFSLDVKPGEYRWSLAVAGQTGVWVRQAMADWEQAEAILVDLSEGGQPRQLASLPVSQGGLGAASSGACAYLAGAGGLSLVDLSDPLIPRQAGVYPYPGGRLALEGDYLYLAGGQMGLWVFRIQTAYGE